MFRTSFVRSGQRGHAAIRIALLAMVAVAPLAAL